jgi:hypothetical protein
MKNKKFDCVKMMRDIRAEVTEELKNLSSQELVDYLNKKYPDFEKKTAEVERRI